MLDAETNDKVYLNSALLKEHDPNTFMVAIAVHLKLATDLSTDDFRNCFKIAKQGRKPILPPNHFLLGSLRQYEASSGSGSTYQRK